MKLFDVYPLYNINIVKGKAVKSGMKTEPNT